MDSHYQKHIINQSEYGNITKEQYLKKAQEFVSSMPGEDILTKTRLNGDILYYNKLTNDFAVKTKDGIIRTFFKPTNGINYFNRQ